MLNINQNFDLKAPVFNFDRDYFNSVEELNAYDTSNVPNHFVTNVAGMLYQFTDRGWLPMIGTILNDPDNPDSRIYNVNLLNDHCYVYINPDDDNYIFYLEAESSNASMDSDGAIILQNNNNTIYPYIDITKEFDGGVRSSRLGVVDNKSFGLTLEDVEDKSIKILTNKELTEEEQGDGYSPVDISLTDRDYSADINAKNGFTHKTDDGFVTQLDGYGLKIEDATGCNLYTSNTGIRLNNAKYQEQISLYAGTDDNYLQIGSDEKFKISRPIDNTEGAIISGIKSLTAFTNPSATKVWATDGSTVDLTTYTNYFNGTTTADKLKSKAVEVIDTTNSVTVSPTGITATNGSTTGNIKMLTNNELTEIEGYMCSPVDMSFTNNDGFSAHINSRAGFIHTTEDRMVSRLNGSGLTVDFPFRDNRKWNSHLDYCGLWFSFNDEDALRIWSGSGDEISIELGSDEETRFKISRPLDNSEGATITGVKSITAFSDSSNTKVFATDGSIADLSTKANASDLNAKANKSDVLLKKNSRGGYYIGRDNDYVASNAFSIGGNTADGSNSFAVGYDTKAYGSYSHVEGQYTEAHGESAHAEGDFTYAEGDKSHSEGNYTRAKGLCSHAEGHNTYADGFAAHAQGNYNVSNKNAIHSVGIGDRTTNKNAEYIYAKNDTNSTSIVDDPKNGYKYLIGVGGYDGISTDNTTYKSVQEVIADLTARIEQLETKVRALEAANTPA